MKILLISSYLPFPLTSGGHIRLYNILKRLSKQHDVRLVCEKRSYQTQDDIEEVKKVCTSVYTVPRKNQWSIENILKTGISRSSFLITGHTNTMMQKKIAQLLYENTFDLIHVETSYVMQNIPKTTIPIVLVEHNIEYLVYQRFVQKTPIYLRPLLLIDVAKLKRIEEAFWKRATHVVTVSPEERDIIGLSNVSIVPNGVDTKSFSMKDKKNIDNKKKTILFIGDFKWIQNRDSVTWIIKDIWPLLKKEETLDVLLWIVGRSIPQTIKKLSSDPKILFDENAPKQTIEIFRKADLLLTPIRIGGGTQYKILEAMASGTPVVTTSLGAEGVAATNEKEIIIADSKESLAAATLEVLLDKKRSVAIAKAAREFIEKRYTWDSIVESLENVYKRIVV